MWTRIVSLLLCLAFVSFSATAAVYKQSFNDKIVFDLSVDQLIVGQTQVEGVSFDTVRAEGVSTLAGVNFEVGAPELPVLRLQVAASSAQDITVTTRQLKSLEVVDVAQMKPIFESAAKIAGARTNIVPLNKTFKSNAPYTIEYMGSVRGQKQFLVTLYPVEMHGFEAMITRSFSVEVPNLQVSKNNATDGILFVVGEKFKNSAELVKYIELKRTSGFNPSRLDVTTHMSADDIRSQIKAAYKKDPALKYVVIIGDSEDVTAKESDNISGITDHYYAAIDTNDYASDILTPDLYVGRFSASNDAELNMILKKYTRYIKGDFSRMDWLSHVSFLATDDRYEVAEGTHNYVIDTYTSKKGYSGVFPAARQNGGDKLYAITNRAGTNDVMKAISQGRSIVNYSGHGANTYWAGPEVDQSHVRSLQTSALPFVISNACITGDFRVDESFAETWQRHEWGAVMFWGSMDSTYWDEDDILERRMYDGIFVNGLKAFGPVTHNALNEVSKFYGGQGRSVYYWETYHMFGDPSLNVRML
ncbi:MAG: hypothetical protein K2P81_10435 [Bacteriovoracaceae bacterium]|nr:hypothetical protein [Bacteriovoracaceae bacterium]